MLPIFSLDHEKTCLTNTVLEPRMGPVPYFLSTMRRLVRLLPYLNSGWDTLPIFLVHKTTYSTTAVLDFRWDISLSPKRIFHIHEPKTIDYYGTRSEKRQISRRDTHPQDGQYKSSLRKNSSNSLTKKSYSHGKKKIQYTLLSY